VQQFRHQEELEQFGRRGGGDYFQHSGQCSNLFSNIKMTVLCMVFSIPMAVIVGMLVILVPLWMTMDKRVASTELGGLAYDGVVSSGGDGTGTTITTNELSTHSHTPTRASLLINANPHDSKWGRAMAMVSCIPIVHLHLDGNFLPIAGMDLGWVFC
jgi:hypothetical protein